MELKVLDTCHINDLQAMQLQQELDKEVVMHQSFIGHELISKEGEIS